MSSLLEDRNGQWTAVSGGVGTVCVKNTTGVLQRVIIPGTYVGTINFHDASGTAGTTSTSQILSLGLPTVTYPTVLETGINFRTGLVYQATGTPVVTIIWE